MWFEHFDESLCTRGKFDLLKASNALSAPMNERFRLLPDYENYPPSVKVIMRLGQILRLPTVSSYRGIFREPGVDANEFMKSLVTPNFNIRLISEKIALLSPLTLAEIYVKLFFCNNEDPMTAVLSDAMKSALTVVYPKQPASFTLAKRIEIVTDQMKDHAIVGVADAIKVICACLLTNSEFMIKDFFKSLCTAIGMATLPVYSTEEIKGLFTFFADCIEYIYYYEHKPCRKFGDLPNLELNFDERALVIEESLGENNILSIILKQKKLTLLPRQFIYLFIVQEAIETEVFSANNSDRNQLFTLKQNKPLIDLIYADAVNKIEVDPFKKMLSSLKLFELGVLYEKLFEFYADGSLLTGKNVASLIDLHQSLKKKKTDVIFSELSEYFANSLGSKQFLLFGIISISNICIKNVPTFKKCKQLAFHAFILPLLFNCNLRDETIIAIATNDSQKKKSESIKTDMKGFMNYKKILWWMVQNFQNA